MDRVCRKCNQSLAIDKFDRRARSTGGRLATCKQCRKERDLRPELMEQRATYAQNNPEKVCTRCNQLKPLSEYYVNNTAIDGRKNTCSECCNRIQGIGTQEHRDKQRKNYHENWVVHILRGAKKRAKQQGLPFNLTLDDIQIPTVCPVLGIPLIIGSGGMASPNTPSLDKVIPALGYVKGNVNVVSWLANNVKGAVYDPEVFDRVAAYIRRELPKNAESGD